MWWKKIVKTLLFPHILIMLLLLPVSVCFLVYAMLNMQESAPMRIVSYVVSAYTLTVWCVRMPDVIRFFRNFKNKNRYMQIWLGNIRLRMNITLAGNVIWNGAYAVMQFGLGIYHRSFWFVSLACYYFLLAVMRLMLVRHISKHSPGEKRINELHRYRTCGWIFLLMNLALSAMIFYMIHENRTVRHHEITTIAMAAYTFTAFTMAVINIIRYRKYNSPVISASRAISLANACVSMLTLERSMLAVFSKRNITQLTQKIFLLLSGSGVSVFIVAMAVYMIVKANRNIKCLERENGQ